MLFSESIGGQESSIDIKVKDLLTEFSFISNPYPTARDSIAEFSFTIDDRPTVREVIAEFSFI